MNCKNTDGGQHWLTLIDGSPRGSGRERPQAMWERHMIEIECDTSSTHGIPPGLIRFLFLHGPLVGAGAGTYTVGFKHLVLAKGYLSRRTVGHTNNISRCFATASAIAAPSVLALLRARGNRIVTVPDPTRSQQHCLRSRRFVQDLHYRRPPHGRWRRPRYR